MHHLYRHKRAVIIYVVAGAITIIVATLMNVLSIMVLCGMTQRHSGNNAQTHRNINNKCATNTLKFQDS